MKSLLRFVVLFSVSLTVAEFGIAQGEAGGANGAGGKSNVLAALTAEEYTHPPNLIESLVLAPRHLNTSLSDLSPDGKLFLVARSGGMPRLADVGRPYYNLGGEMVDWQANRDRSMTTRGFVALELWDSSTGAKRNIEIPKDCRVGGASWSPDGGKVAFLANFKDASHIYVADVASGKSKRITKNPILGTLVSTFEWTAANKIACVVIPDGRGPEPKEAPVAVQPRVQLTDPSKNRFRTYPALLKTLHDQELLEYYSKGQLALIDANSGAITKVGKPTMIRSFDFAPDAKFARVTLMEKPFAYVVPASSFGSKEELWDDSGKALTELAKRPLNLGTGPADDPPAGPPQQQTGTKRNLAWRPDGKGMTYLEQEQPPRAGGTANPPDLSNTSNLSDEQGRGGGGRFGGGQGAAGAQTGPPRKYRVYQWLAPFGKDDAKVIYESDQRLSSVSYSADCQTLFMAETRDGNDVQFAVRLSEPTKKMVLTSNKTNAESLNNPGTLMTKDGLMGMRVVRTSSDGKKVFLQGTQYSDDPLKEAPRPFIDSVEIETGKKERVWQSSADMYETVSAVLDDDVTKLVINRQSPTMVPNAHLLTLSSAPPQGPDTADREPQTANLKQLTDNKDFHFDISTARRDRFQVTRPDGFKFWVEVRMPKYGSKFPAFFWFYPNEFTDQRAYDRGKRTFNKNTFPNFGASSKDFLVALGYAVVAPDCPIVGPTGRMNDSYIPDLKANLWATIDALDKKGYVDRDRLAIGGHSYGAFSTANAMVHTPYFKAGIAGDGAYNRLLTPGGFQTEQRQLWEGREMYLSTSPLLYAEQMTGALLMYHGMDDQNVGTFPINSERLFQALDNLGKTAALYMYPYEDHGQIAQETVLDQWARWVAWLEKYVLNAGKEEAKPATPPPSQG